MDDWDDQTMVDTCLGRPMQEEGKPLKSPSPPRFQMREKNAGRTVERMSR
jgi:hypothetical protein